MAKLSNATSREPMIHVHLDDKTHRRLKIMVAQKKTTIQQLVKDLIRRKVGESCKRKT